MGVRNSGHVNFPVDDTVLTCFIYFIQLIVLFNVNLIKTYILIRVCLVAFFFGFISVV